MSQERETIIRFASQLKVFESKLPLDVRLFAPYSIINVITYVYCFAQFLESYLFQFLVELSIVFIQLPSIFPRFILFNGVDEVKMLIFYNSF